MRKRGREEKGRGNRGERERKERVWKKRGGCRKMSSTATGTCPCTEQTPKRNSTDHHRERQQGQKKDDVEVEEAVQQVI